MQGRPDPQRVATLLEVHGLKGVLEVMAEVYLHSAIMACSDPDAVVGTFYSHVRNAVILREAAGKVE